MSIIDVVVLIPFYMEILLQREYEAHFSVMCSPTVVGHVY